MTDAIDPSALEAKALTIIGVKQEASCQVPSLSLGERMKMASDADFFGEGAYDEKVLLKGSDLDIARAYLKSAENYMKCAIGD